MADAEENKNEKGAPDTETKVHEVQIDEVKWDLDGDSLGPEDSLVDGDGKPKLGTLTASQHVKKGDGKDETYSKHYNLTTDLFDTLNVSLFKRNPEFLEGETALVRVGVDDGQGNPVPDLEVELAVQNKEGNNINVTPNKKKTIVVDPKKAAVAGFNMPGLTAENSPYRFRVGVDNGGITLDGTITITKAGEVVKWTEVPSDETIEPQKKVDLAWDVVDPAASVTKFQIEVSYDNKHSFEMIKSVRGGKRTTHWNVPRNAIGHRCFLRITAFDKDDELGKDDSPKPFDIKGTQGMLNVELNQYEFNINQGESVNLIVSVDDSGGGVNELAVKVNCNGEDYEKQTERGEHNVPSRAEIPITGLTAREEPYSFTVNVEGNDVYDAPRMLTGKITVGPTDGAFKIWFTNVPTDKDNVHVGKKITVTWDVNDPTDVSYYVLYFATKNTGWEVANSEIGTARSVEWTVPDKEADEAFLLVAAFDQDNNELGQAESKAFKISAYPHEIILHSPVEGEPITNPQNIKWEVTGFTDNSVNPIISIRINVGGSRFASIPGSGLRGQISWDKVPEVEDDTECIIEVQAMDRKTELNISKQFSFIIPGKEERDIRIRHQFFSGPNILAVGASSESGPVKGVNIALVIAGQTKVGRTDEIDGKWAYYPFDLSDLAPGTYQYTLSFTTPREYKDLTLQEGTLVKGTPEVTVNIINPSTDHQEIRSEIKLEWEIKGEGVDALGFSTPLDIAYRFGENQKFTNIPLEEQPGVPNGHTSQRGSVVWRPPNFENNIDCEIAFHFTALGKQDDKGLFIVKDVVIVGEDEPEPPIDEDIEKIINMIKYIKRPAKTGWFAKESSIGTFLYGLINSGELDSYFALGRRITELNLELGNPKIRNKIDPKTLKRFNNQIVELLEVHSQLSGLQDTRALKSRITRLWRGLLDLIKSRKDMRAELKLLLEHFEKTHNVALTRVDIRTILANKTYLSWFLENGSRIDGILAMHGWDTYKITDFYKMLENWMRLANQMYNLLREIRTSLEQIRKDIRPR